MILRYILLSLLSILYTNHLDGEIYVSHEWDPLKTVIVGGVIKHSFIDKILKNPVVYNKELEKEINTVITILKNHGVNVYHFDKFADAHKLVMLLYPRDPLIVIGNNIIGCAMKAQRRKNETIVMRNELLSMFLENGATYTEMPLNQKLLSNKQDKYLLEGGNVLINGNELYIASVETKNFSSLLWFLTKSKKFLNKFVNETRIQSLYQYLERARSHTYSSKGAIEWLRQHVSTAYTIYEIKITAQNWVDLDKCLSLVCPGLGIICRDVIASPLPDSIKNWDFIEISQEEMENGAASPLILDEKNIILDNRNKRIAHELRARGINVIEVPFTHTSRYGGSLRSFHQALLRKE